MQRQHVHFKAVGPNYSNKLVVLLKGECREIFDTFLTINSTWAQYEQAKTVS